MSISKFFKTGLITLCTFGLLTTPAFAATSGTNDATVSVSGGTLSLTPPPSTATITGITLDGTTQTTNSTNNVGGDVVINDPRGTGDGWRVQVSASQFTETVDPGIQLPLNSLQLGGMTIVAGSGSNGNPTLVNGPTWTIDTGSNVTLLSAALNDGMGTYNLKFDPDALTLTVPASAKAGSYSSTMTWTVVSGP